MSGSRPNQNLLNGKTLRVLMVEDSPEDAELGRRHLAKAGYQVFIQRVTSADEMRVALTDQKWDVVLADYAVPNFGALPALELLKEDGRDIPFIIVSGTITDDIAVAAMRAGAHDYVLKSNLARLLPAIERETAEAEARQQKREMQQELKQADAAIHVGEARLQGIIGSAMDAIVTIDEQQRIVVFNHAAEKMFLCEASDAIGSTLERFIPTPYRAVHRDHLRKFGAEGATARSMQSPGVLTALRSNGEEFPIEATISQVEAAGQKIFTVIMRDITARKHTEEALRQSEERFRSMYQHAAVGIKQATLDGRLLMVNPALCKMLGYSEAELLSKTSNEMTHPDDQARDAEQLQSMLREERDYCEIEKRYLHRDGSSVSVNVTTSLVKDDSGTALYRVAIVQELGERKRAELLEEQLRQARKMEAVGRLAGGVAHDFNTLLNIMLGYAELLLSELPVQDKRRERVEQIEKSAMTGALLTKQLLAFSRKQVISPQVIDLNHTVAGLKPILRRLLPEDIDLRVHLAESPCPAKIDDVQIQQVILNLITNARDAMPHGGVLNVEVRTVDLDEAYAEKHPWMAPGCYEMLAVSDTGVGMDAETAAHIFEPFFTTKESGKGTGLGLATVYGVVKQNGGDIWVYSEPGEGATFKVFLPRSNEAAQSKEPSRPASGKLSGTETILLVEDSKPLRELTREILSREGYQVLEAGDGVEALEVLKKHGGRICLVMTDVVMPRMRGTDLALHVTLLYPATAVIFLSGYTEEAISHFQESDRITVLEKPYTANSLLQTVRLAIDSKKIAA